MTSTTNELPPCNLAEPRPNERRHSPPDCHDWHHRHCYGDILTLYARFGSKATWTKAARVCRRCGTFWPTATLIPRPGQRITERATVDWPSSGYRRHYDFDD